MKIGILTYHDGLNHGAYLQAYATMRVLEEMGHEAVIINYKNREHWLMEDVRPWMAYRRPIRFIDRFHKQRAFHKDQKRFNQTSFTTKQDAVRTIKFDAVVVGSDVVWNYKIFGFDELYFGGVNANRKIAYAPSFGWVDFGETYPEGVAEGIRSFDALSARDENTSKIVEQLTGSAPQMVLDPTLIYDFEKESPTSNRLCELGKYLLVYAYISDPKIIAAVKDIARERGLITLSLGYRQSWCDKVLMDVGPIEWVALYQNADYVATSTFHGTIFALKCKKEFLYVCNEKARNRVKSLFALCEIDADVDQPDGSYLSLIPDYEKLDRLLLPHIQTSRNWLKEALDSKCLPAEGV